MGIVSLVVAVAVPVVCAALYGFLSGWPEQRERFSVAAALVFAGLSLLLSLPVGAAFEYLDKALHPEDDMAGFLVAPGTICFASFLSPVTGVVCAVVLVAARNRRVVAVRRCTECGSDLTGNISGRCPECGTAVRSVGGPDAVRNRSVP